MKNKYDQDLQEANATIQQLQDQLAGVAFPVSSHVVACAAGDRGREAAGDDADNAGGVAPEGAVGVWASHEA